jgi:hypothetical protein
MKHVFSSLSSFFLAGSLMQLAMAKNDESLTLEDPLETWFPELKATENDKAVSARFNDPDTP